MWVVVVVDLVWYDKVPDHGCPRDGDGERPVGPGPPDEVKEAAEDETEQGAIPRVYFSFCQLKGSFFFFFFLNFFRAGQ